MRKLLFFCTGLALALSALAYFPSKPQITTRTSAAQALCWPGDSAQTCWQHLEHQRP